MEYCSAQVMVTLKISVLVYENTRAMFLLFYITLYSICFIKTTEEQSF